MRKCKQCGSYALNAHIGDPDQKLCDVCYWKQRATVARESCDELAERYNGDMALRDAEMDQLRAEVERLRNDKLNYKI